LPGIGVRPIVGGGHNFVARPNTGADQPSQDHAKITNTTRLEPNA
jgi:hypothetical protein